MTIDDLCARLDAAARLEAADPTSLDRRAATRKIVRVRYIIAAARGVITLHVADDASPEDILDAAKRRVCNGATAPPGVHTWRVLTDDEPDFEPETP